MDKTKDGDYYLRVYCFCGMWIRGDIEVELISNVHNHIDEAHAENQPPTYPPDEVIIADAERVPV